ncbi:MBL fold metallo-hydrolase [Aggregatilinea lenta]|uniref:MBL fold metallo-hydrolase n=1 Tax=Aggregatilinea lenta TaxID=913108 RepID=UPI000E5BEE2D|nr:MBL fold metallo-hydrolase [Aggregatilinea lenta]
MAIEILKLTLGPIQTNCYIVGDTDTGSAVVIDPVDRAGLILKTAQDQGWTIRDILATHGHFDHIMASDELKRLTGAPFRLHRLDLPLVQLLPQATMAWLGVEGPPAAEPDGFVAEGDAIEVDAIRLEVLFTPGHAPGHVVYVLRSENTVFGGDVLFRGSIGRTDLPGGDYETLMRSIVDKLLPLGDSMAVLPGHMDNTTIGAERATNPFILDYLHTNAR